MNISVSKITNMVEGIDIPSSPLSYGIVVPDDIGLSKMIMIQDGEINKTDQDGNALYGKSIYTDVQVKVGTEETTDDTGKPIMMSVQKTNADGDPLYSRDTFDDNGNIVESGEITVAIDADGNYYTPVIIQVQKKSDDGELLFTRDIMKTVSRYDGEEETTDMTDRPIMVPHMVQKYVSLRDMPLVFTVDEILTSKYQRLLDGSNKDNIIFDIFIDDDIDTSDPKHLANTGVALLQLLPDGQAITKSIPLATASTMFTLLELDADGVDIYLNGIKFTDSKVLLQSATNKCVVKFINTTDKPVVIRSYAIAY